MQSVHLGSVGCIIYCQAQKRSAVLCCVVINSQGLEGVYNNGDCKAYSKSAMVHQINPLTTLH